ncbi:MAG: DUF2281 domain-containing protein [Methylococcales bacterium]|jgi:hypothetical protein|nr:DUF2281 domain-containing protein [Methylococcales bacterium]MBT7410789.1 DUF2281 domain-containing protein [Methylococcales bacterium]
MNTAELIHKEIDELPAEKAQEVLDFILFLKTRSENQQWRDLIEAQQQSLSSVWDNAEDEVWNDV